MFRDKTRRLIERFEHRNLSVQSISSSPRGSKERGAYLRAHRRWNAPGIERSPIGMVLELERDEDPGTVMDRCLPRSSAVLLEGFRVCSCTYLDGFQASVSSCIVSALIGKRSRPTSDANMEGEGRSRHATRESASISENVCSFGACTGTRLSEAWVSWNLVSLLSLSRGGLDIRSLAQKEEKRIQRIESIGRFQYFSLFRFAPTIPRPTISKTTCLWNPSEMKRSTCMHDSNAKEHLSCEQPIEEERIPSLSRPSFLFVRPTRPLRRLGSSHVLSLVPRRMNRTRIHVPIFFFF